MQEFLTTLVSFPTIVFTGALAVALLYWLVVIFGALDLDFLDSVLGLDTMDAAFDGALESLEGAAEGVVEGAVEGAAEGAAESIEGALDAGAEGAADVVDAADADVADGSSGGLLSSLLNAMGVRGVPITVVGTFVIFWAWILSYLATRFIGPVGASVIVALAVAVTACFGALVLGALTSRPFKKVFVTQLAPRRASLVGKMCTILSAKVDGNFGRAEIEDGGAGFVAEVRCPQENELRRGAKALVYRYEPSDGIFFVGPVDQALAEAARIAEES